MVVQWFGLHAFTVEIFWEILDPESTRPKPNKQKGWSLCLFLALTMGKANNLTEECLETLISLKATAQTFAVDGS